CTTISTSLPVLHSSSFDIRFSFQANATLPVHNSFPIPRRHGLLPAQVYKWRRLAELGIIGMPGASELPSFVAVEITKDVRSLAADRKSTRLNSSHLGISYAVFCLKKKTRQITVSHSCT